MKEKARKFITELREILDKDLKDLQINVVVDLIESDGPDARDQKSFNVKLIEIKSQIRLRNKAEALRVLGEIPAEYLTKSQKASREKVLKGENIADLSSFEAAVLELESASSDEAINVAAENANSAVEEIIGNESKYGPLQNKVKDLFKKFKEFKDSVQVKAEVEKKAFYPVVLRKVAEFTANSANRVMGYEIDFLQKTTQAKFDFQKINEIQQQGKTDLERIDEEFSENINNLLNIPREKNDAVKNSDEYKHFMKLCFALRDRMKDDTAKKQEEQLFSEEEKQKRKTACENMMRGTPAEAERIKQEFESGETMINITEYICKFKEFFNEIWKFLLTVVDKFGLLPETTQVRNLKNSGEEWRKFVAERGSEVVKNHGLAPLDF